jgi:hypothetical protein
VYEVITISRPQISLINTDKLLILLLVFLFAPLDCLRAELPVVRE